MSAVIDQVVQARLITPGPGARPLSAVLHYDAADPLAVGIAFPPDISLDGYEAVWTFSRELLDDGLRAHAGEGRVQLWPAGPARTMLELRAAEGVARVQFDSADLRRFLQSSYRAVNRGEEFLGQDLDPGLAELLRSA